MKNKFQSLVKYEYIFFKRDVHLSCVCRDGGAGLEEDCERLGPKNDKIVWIKYNPCQYYSEFLPVGVADIIHITSRVAFISPCQALLFVNNYSYKLYLEIKCRYKVHLTIKKNGF